MGVGLGDGLGVTEGCVSSVCDGVGGGVASVCYVDEGSSERSEIWGFPATCVM